MFGRWFAPCLAIARVGAEAALHAPHARRSCSWCAAEHAQHQTTVAVCATALVVLVVGALRAGVGAPAGAFVTGEMWNALGISELVAAVDKAGEAVQDRLEGTV